MPAPKAPYTIPNPLRSGEHSLQAPVKQIPTPTVAAPETPTNSLLQWLSTEVKSRLEHIDEKLDGKVCQKMDEILGCFKRTAQLPLPGDMSSAGSRLASNRTSNSNVGILTTTSSFGAPVTPLTSAWPQVPSMADVQNFVPAESQLTQDDMYSHQPSQVSECRSSIGRLSRLRGSKASSGTGYGNMKGAPTTNSKATRMTYASFKTRKGGKLKRPSVDKLYEVQKMIAAQQNSRGIWAGMMWRFLENPYSSIFAYTWAIFLPGFVVCSVFVSFWQTVDGSPIRGTFAEVFQVVVEVVFGLELLARFYACPDRVMFAKDVMNFIDFLSAAPLLFRVCVAFMSLTGEDLSAEEILSRMSLLPVLKLLKLTRRFEKIKLLMGAFLLALEALPVLLYTLAVIALMFSALIYSCEREDTMENLPQALWFVVVTMTTVGYGDITPETREGYIVTTALMVFSGLYMAIPIGIVGNAFSTVWSERDRVLLKHRLRDAFLMQGFTERAVHDIIKGFAGEAEELGVDELHEMLESMHIYISYDRVLSLLESLDLDGSGRISVEELLTGLFPAAYADYFSSLSQGKSPTLNHLNSTSSMFMQAPMIAVTPPVSERDI